MTGKTSRFVSADAFLKSLTDEERASAKLKAAEIIASEVTLRDLRRAGELTQASIGAKLKIGQDQVSRLEKRTDMLLSTLHKYVAAMGGSVHVIVELPGRPAVKLSSLSGIFNRSGPTRRRPPKKTRTKAA